MPESDRTDYIAHMARELGITLPDAEVARVKMIFANLERGAALLNGTPLDDATIAAAVFRPDAVKNSGKQE